MQTNVRKAGMEVAQWIPRLWYILVVNRGNTAPKIERKTAAAARTEAAYTVYASIRQLTIGRITRTHPKPNGAERIMLTAQ